MVHTKESLNKKTVIKLKELCKKEKISNYSGKSKGELINYILQKMGASGKTGAAKHKS